ncbi:OTU protein [Coemansia sp. RSA 1821]|nr:OTU protein [Coemansia sp. RSA 1821]
MNSHLEATFEDLEARHRREKKELTARITALKRAVPKGDKRKKKEVAAEIADLEKQHNERQEEELRRFNAQAQQGAQEAQRKKGESEAEDTEVEKVAGPSDSEVSSTPAKGLYGSAQPARPGGKKNKAKLRQQRRAEEIRRMKEEAEREAEDMVDVAAVETQAVENLVASHGLRIQQIRPDGHCLYSAFADQISTYHDQPATHLQMRQRAAEYMRNHRDDFIPFMTHENGEMFSEDDFERYCNDIEATATWGGQQEITALSHALQLPVNIYQPGMPVLQIGEGTYASDRPINLSYHRHAYGLGEHYNSLRKIE